MRYKKLMGFFVCALSLNLMSFFSPLAQNIDVRPPQAATVSASTVADEKKVVVGGKTVGITLNFGGAMVVGTSDVPAQDNKKYSPAKKSGFKTGDIIIDIDGKKISSVDDLISHLKGNHGEEIAVKVLRDEKEYTAKMTPRKGVNDEFYKIGAWVKDATSGVGTLTYYDPEDKSCGALGHGITDPDTGKLLRVAGGDVLSSTVVAVDKGEKGDPGELKGIFMEQSDALGSITENTKCGLFGSLNGNADDITSGELMQIAKKEEIKEGECQILSNIEGNKVERFGGEIQKVMPASGDSSKSMVIKITDENLISRTGGIVQGMSGSPVVQNGKLVGAVTHVFVNDPTRGYGIFIENMLAK